MEGGSAFVSFSVRHVVQGELRKGESGWLEEFFDHVGVAVEYRYKRLTIKKFVARYPGFSDDILQGEILNVCGYEKAVARVQDGCGDDETGGAACELRLDLLKAILVDVEGKVFLGNVGEGIFF